jgi:hypothetical protein
VAIARDGTGLALVDTVGSASVVLTFTTNASRFLTICGDSTVNGVSTVVDSTSTTWTLKQFTGSVGFLWIAYRENAPSITSVTITLGGSTFSNAKLDQWTGVKTSGAFDAQTTANGTPGSPTFSTGNHTAGDPNCLILANAYADDNSNQAWTTTLGAWTELGQFGDTTVAIGNQCVYQIASGSTGPFSLTFNYPPNNTTPSTQVISFLPLSTPVSLAWIKA